MPLILCRLCGELVNSNSERCKCGGSTRQTSTLATSPADSNVDRWQKKYASPLSAPPSLPCSSSTSTVQPLPPTSLGPPPSPSLNKTYGSLLSLSAPLSCVSCTRPFPPDATLYPAKPSAARPNYFDPPEEETYKCRACYTKEDSIGGCEKCGRAVLGVKEIGKSEGQFVRSGKKVWCQGCFACDGCSTLLRPSPSKPPLLHPITGKPICEDCLFNPPQLPASSSARRPLPQRTTLTSSTSNLGGFGPSLSTSSISREAAQPNAAVEELRTRLGITSLRSSVSSPAVPTRGEPSSTSATRPPPLPASASHNAPRPSTATNLKSPTSSLTSPAPRPTPIPFSSAPNSSCPTCLAPLTSPPATSAASARRSPYDRSPPPAPVTSIALITLPAQLGGQTYHAVCFRCDGCGDSLVAAEGEDKEVGVGVNERGKGVCLKCVKPTRFSVSSSTRSIPSSSAPSPSSKAFTTPRTRYESNPTPPPSAPVARSSYARPLQAAGNERVPVSPASPVGGGIGVVGGPKKIGGSILERAGVKKRVE